MPAQKQQPKNYQPFLFVLSMILGLGAVVPAYLGILLWEKYQEGAFPPLSVILHRGEIFRVMVIYDRGKIDVTDPALIDRYYQSFLKADHPVRYQVPMSTLSSGPRSVRFFRKDGSMLPVELGRFEGGALYCPTLERSYIDDSGDLLALARETKVYFPR